MRNKRPAKPRRPRNVPADTQLERFDECVECRFYRPYNTNPACKECPAGDNFEAKVRGLDLSRSSLSFSGDSDE